jgi:hypothetical protein
MDKIGDFFLTLLHAATNTHILHLQTTSYAEHVALGEFYTELPELVDTVIESIQGRYGQIIQYPQDYFVPSNSGLEELEALKTYVEQNRQFLPQDSEIQNDVDAISSLINSTIYKLKFLK